MPAVAPASTVIAPLVNPSMLGGVYSNVPVADSYTSAPCPAFGY